MARLKSYFPVPYISGSFVVFLHSVGGLAQHGVNSAWLGAFVAALPAAYFFARLMTRQFARTSRYLPSLIAGAAVGTLLSLLLPGTGSPVPLLYAAVIGLGGSLLYIFWYSPYPPQPHDALTVGQILPDFRLPDQDGREVSADEMRCQPALLLFFRGNWCPLCMTQINEVAALYREIDARGTKVYLISPQDSRHTRELANRLDVPFVYLVDEGSALAARLGIFHRNGVPKGMFGYDADTVVPTVVGTATGGRVLFAEIADNYRVRPDPGDFLRAFDQQADSDDIVQKRRQR